MASVTAGAWAEPSALASAPTTFVREQAASPVKWERWTPEALARAQAAGKPVYVFIGSFLSELSRATARQTLANVDNAAFLNEHFACFLVDREEQPEVAATVRAYLRAVKQTDGWPAHVWLTPELQPFEGAGYLPPTEEWGKPGFMKVAQQAWEAWAANPAACRARAAEAVAQLESAAPPLPAGTAAAGPTQARLTAAAEAWRALFDATHGGFGDTPKAPEPELLRFLLTRPGADRDAALATLRALATSALRDPLDGGFFRNATDAAWLVPYPQKTLADQARLALAFLDGAQVSASDAVLFAAAARGALDYALTTLARPDGTFAAAEDGTDDEYAGYYAWTAAEIDAALGADAAAFKTAHGVAAEGNVAADSDPTSRYPGKNLLRSAKAPDVAACEALRQLRARRPALRRDERATAGAHGLLLAALVRAGAPGGERRYAAAAEKLHQAMAGSFVLDPAAGTLRRIPGADAPAAPADYAALALGLRTLGDPAATALADRLLARLDRDYFDAAAGHYRAASTPAPAGIFAPAPAWGDPLSAEALVLLAGASAAVAGPLADGLSAFVDQVETTAPGEALLALQALFPSSSPQ